MNQTKTRAEVIELFVDKARDDWSASFTNRILDLGRDCTLSPRVLDAGVAVYRAGAEDGAAVQRAELEGRERELTDRLRTANDQVEVQRHVGASLIALSEEMLEALGVARVDNALVCSLRHRLQKAITDWNFHL